MTGRKSFAISHEWFGRLNRSSFVALRSLDRVIIGVTIALSFSGLVMVFSSSGIMADARFSESTYYLQRQATWLILGLSLLLFTAFQDYEIWESLTPKVLIVSVLLLILVLFFGSEINGARRWLKVGGISFQPTEMTKLGVVLYLACYLAKPQLRISEWSYGFLPPVVIVGLISGLVVVQPDLGGAVVLCLLLLGMLYLAGARLLHLLAVCLSLIPPLVGLIWWSPERWERIMSFWDPWKDPTGGGYQLMQSFFALGNGGFWGVGLGQGKQKLFYLPEGHTDFVFALIGEELGLIGTTTLLFLFAVIIFKGFHVSARARDSFGRYLALGITLLLGIQVLINAGVVSGLLPTKGLTLPLVSYGGSSLLTNLLAIGILLSIARGSAAKV